MIIQAGKWQKIIKMTNHLYHLLWKKHVRLGYQTSMQNVELNFVLENCSHFISYTCLTAH